MLRQFMLLSIVLVTAAQGCAEEGPVESAGGSSGTSPGGNSASGGGGKGGDTLVGAGGSTESGGAAGDHSTGGVFVGAGGFGDDPLGCFREYDLERYAELYGSSTEGLCPAEQVSHCDCDEDGTQDKIICAPDKSGCGVQKGTCGPEVDCGWHDCDALTMLDDFCLSIEAEVREAFDSYGPFPCVHDGDCFEGSCTLRVYNMMFCIDDPPHGGAGQGASGGQSGAAGAGGG
jgi:hypothetical protein